MSEKNTKDRSPEKGGSTSYGDVLAANKAMRDCRGKKFGYADLPERDRSEPPPPPRTPRTPRKYLETDIGGDAPALYELLYLGLLRELRAT